MYMRKNNVHINSAIVLVLYLIICIVLSSCHKSHQYPKELVEIDSLCDIRPYTAQAKLRRIGNKYEIKDDENNWYCRFLRLKSIAKANGNYSDVSEIQDIIKHYEETGDEDILPQVLYCTGCIYRNSKDITISSQYFLECLKRIKYKQDNTLLYLCYYQLGYNYSMQGLHKVALPYQLKSLRYNQKSNVKSRVLYDYEELAWTYGSLGKKNVALKYIQKANSLAYSIKDSDKISETECQLAVHYMENRQLNKAKQHIDISLKQKNWNNLSALYSTALEIYSRLGFNDTAKIFCDSTITCGNIYGKKYAYWWLAIYHNKRGEQQATHYCIQKYKEYSDSVEKAVVAEASAKANALYNYSIKEKENITLKNENTIKTLYIIVIFSLLIIVMLSSFIQHKRIARKKRAIEKRYNMLVALREKESKATERIIKEKEEELEDIKKKLSSINDHETQNMAELRRILILKEKQLHEINNDVIMKKFCDSSMRKTSIYRRIISLYESNSHIMPDEWNDLRQAVFGIYSSFEDRLSELCPMSDTELKACLLMRIGLNSVKISTLLNKSQSSIYSISRRLCQKNFGNFASPSEWEKFIKSIY